MAAWEAALKSARLGMTLLAFERAHRSGPSPAEGMWHIEPCVWACQLRACRSIRNAEAKMLTICFDLHAVGPVHGGPHFKAGELKQNLWLMPIETVLPLRGGTWSECVRMGSSSRRIRRARLCDPSFSCCLTRAHWSSRTLLVGHRGQDQTRFATTATIGDCSYPSSIPALEFP